MRIYVQLFILAMMVFHFFYSVRMDFEREAKTGGGFQAFLISVGLSLVALAVLEQAGTFDELISLL